MQFYTRKQRSQEKSYVLGVKRRKNPIKTLDSIVGQSQFYLCLVSHSPGIIVRNTGRKLKQIDMLLFQLTNCSVFQQTPVTLSYTLALLGERCTKVPEDYSA